MLNKLIRPEIAKLAAYEWELSNNQLAEAMDLKSEQIIRFDTNTSPFVLQPVMNILAQKFPKMPINEYPDTSYTKLTKLMAKYTVQLAKYMWFLNHTARCFSKTKVSNHKD